MLGPIYDALANLNPRLSTRHYARAEVDHCTGWFPPPTEGRRDLNKLQVNDMDQMQT